MQCCPKPAQLGNRRSPLATMQGSETSDMCSSRGGHHRKACRDIGGCTRERDQQRCLHFQRQWRLERRQQRRQRPGGSGLAVGRIVRCYQGKANRRSWAFHTVAAAPARRQPLSVAACEIQRETYETHFGMHVEDPTETIFPQAYAAFFGLLGFGLLPLQGQTRLADLPYFLGLAAVTIYIGAHKGLNSKQRQTISLEQVTWLRIHHRVLLQARMVALQKLPAHSGPLHRVSATQICRTQDQSAWTHWQLHDLTAFCSQPTGRPGPAPGVSGALRHLPADQVPAAAVIADLLQLLFLVCLSTAISARCSLLLQHELA